MSRTTLGSILCFILLLIGDKGMAGEAGIPLPSLPQKGKTVQDFVPKGWHLLAQTTGELNKADKEVTALALASDAENVPLEKLQETPRLLVLLFQAPEERLQLSALSDKVLLCKACGGVFGDPFEGLSIERGVVVVKHYGGSSDRWAYVYRFRYQEGDWFLIGKTESTHNVFSLASSETDTNFLTGVTLKEVVTEKGRKITKKIVEPKKPLQRLSEFKGL